MEAHKHGYLFREKDIDRIIAQYGRRAPQEVRVRTFESLQAEREKFRRLEQYRTQQQERSRSRSI